MNIKELVEFLKENYAEDEVLLWQTISKDDVEGMTDADISDDKWAEFVENSQDYLASQMSQSASEEWFDFYDEDEEDED